MPLPNTDSFYVTPCTASELKTIILNMKSSNGVDADGYSTKIMKAIADYISVPLMFIFNKSFLTEVFPDSLKHAKITSVYKSDDKLLINNYGPISILPVFSKVLDKIMHQKLISFFVDKCNILSQNQYSYRAKHSPTRHY